MTCEVRKMWVQVLALWAVSCRQMISLLSLTSVPHPFVPQSLTFCLCNIRLSVLCMLSKYCSVEFYLRPLVLLFYSSLIQYFLSEVPLPPLPATQALSPPDPLLFPSEKIRVLPCSAG